MENNRLRTLNRFVAFIATIIALIGVYQFVSALLAARTSGTLDIQAWDKSAIMSISQPGHQADIIGTGKARVRLPKGLYVVSGTVNGKQSSTVVHINAKQLTKTTLKLTASTGPPTVDQIDFENLTELLSNGISSDQVAILRQYFFEFKQSAQAVTITPGSVSPAPHNPNTDTSFTVNFTVKVDNIPYAAKITYADSESLQLYLYNPQGGNQVFDSGNIGPGPVNENDVD